MVNNEKEEKKEKSILAKIKFYFDWAFKIFLLLLGIINLFGYFGHQGDIMAVVTLFLLWLHFDPVKLIFGNSKRWLNYAVIGVFYVFVLDAILQLFRALSTKSQEFLVMYPPIDKLLADILGNYYLPVRQFFIDVYYSNIDTSSFSSIIGFILLLLATLYITLKLELKKDSMVYPLLYLFNKNPKFWGSVSTEKSKFKYSLVKFALCFFSLLLFSHYFFSLVNQWFIVTIGKSTFILAFLFVVKDIKNTRIKILDEVGSFDEKLIYLTRKVFQDPKYFLTGFGIMLAFHYLSDANLFFLHYIVPYIPLDEYYVTLIGEANRVPVWTLISGEQAAGLFESIVKYVVYAFSILGAFFILAVPVVFIFMSVSKKNIKDYLEKKSARWILWIIFVSMTVFIIAPWMTPYGIFTGSDGQIVGIYGVDFITQQISGYGIPLIYIFFAIIALSALFLIFSKRHWMQEYSVTIVTLYSLVYLGLYVWHFFTSAAFYYYHLIIFSISSNNLILLLLFITLLLIETLFYVGGFLYMGYKISREVITQKTRYIVTDNSMILWTVIVMAIPTFFLLNGTAAALTIASVIIVSLFVFNYSLYKEFTGEEHKDEYILSITQVIALFQIIVILEMALGNFIEQTLILLIGVILLLVLSFALLRFYNIRLKIKKINLRGIPKIFFSGALFGVMFYFVPDPIFAQKIPVDILLVYIILVAVFEELLFRGVVFNIAQNAFSFKRAVFLQSLVFALVHFIGIQGILMLYSDKGFTGMLGAFYIFLYAALLFSFAMFAALVYYRQNKNIANPILLHLIANIVPFVLFMVL